MSVREDEWPSGLTDDDVSDARKEIKTLTAERDALRDHVEVLECRNAEQVEITLEAGRQIAALTARVELLERLGENLKAHVRNCGGCIGCDEVVAEWIAARKS